MRAGDWLSGAVFKFVHGNNLVYNQCWEDPRLDRVALDLGPDDNVMVITSAGCNALDYAICGPRNVHAVDMNPRQNALLELKLAGIRRLQYEQFFDMFGRGRMHGAASVYTRELREDLSPWSRNYWDNHIHFFSNHSPGNSLYFHGTSGLAAKMVNVYVNRLGIREGIDDILAAKTVEEQQEIFYSGLWDQLWNRKVQWAVGRDSMLSLLGVPRAQREYLESTYNGGISKFIEDCIESVFACLPLGDNYFWRVYLTGSYTKECCPEYLKEENFEALKGGLVDNVHVHTNTVQGFLESSGEPITRLILLDHMDWLSSHKKAWLWSEWQAIVDRAAPDARILWRSGGTKVDFVDPIEVNLAGQRVRIGELLKYNQDLANELHPTDRVHTYGSFYIADLATA